MSILSNRIVVSMILSQDLALRYNARALFDKIESLPDSHITVDFSSVRTMTRSFAQEYLSRKAKSNKIIQEINVSPDIRKMFEVVETVFEKPKIIELKETITLDLEWTKD